MRPNMYDKVQAAETYNSSKADSLEERHELLLGESVPVGVVNVLVADQERDQDVDLLAVLEHLGGGLQPTRLQRFS